MDLTKSVRLPRAGDGSMNRFLRRLIEQVVQKGSLSVTDASGATFRFGDGSGEPVHFEIRTRRAEMAIALDPMLAFPEAYMDGEVEFLRGDVYGFLQIIYRNFAIAGSGTSWMQFVETLRGLFRRLQQINTASRARRNVQRHYDLSNELYRLFLDRDMQYSCAYFDRPGMPLEEAQLSKMRRIAAKLRLEAGQSVLDIGSGWGGLGLYLARNFDVHVRGVTLSDEQLDLANGRTKEEGLETRVRFELRDYRDLSGRFDRIVSVGMFEHVGVNHYRTFLEQCAALLKPQGVMLLHTIGVSGPPRATSPFIRKYIFPGGYIPALSEVLPVIEETGLIVTDVEVLRLHYAETLRCWRERFGANREKARQIHDERFCRMWEFYLAASETIFRWQDYVVFQIQLAHQKNAVPITRDYIDGGDRMRASREIANAPSVAAQAAQ